MKKNTTVVKLYTSNHKGVKDMFKKFRTAIKS